ncbi:SRPBCC family protein [Thalassotalea sp. M1531]|uniref:SRPBCC family protein n=1 Tax=Thalassotalea algicola TaxID=2716224 RepID=A0A7Y0LEI8_9GAMM|nr:SRPBCC family protein [Thalassotalea algicola]NMP31705.1 SRPBCC family protein [Thalassotalea algicola]
MVNLVQQVKAEPEQLLNLLIDHENLSRFFNASFNIVRASQEGEIIGGKGTQRRVTTMGQCFIEEITKADVEGIEYHIVGSRPLKHHRGNITFSPNSQGTLMSYYIEGIAPSYLPSFLVQYLLNRDIQKTMKAIAKHFDTK